MTALRTFKKRVAKNGQLYLLLFPAFALVFVFAYIPMPGVVLSFMNYDMFEGFSGSEWVGLEHVRAIFELPMMTESIWNTLLVSILTLVVCFPAPIMLAILLNELRLAVFKRVVQTVFYLPHFLSWISVIGIAYGFYALYGPLNDLRIFLFGPGTERLMFLANQHWFIPNVLLLSMWKELGWSTIIFLASIASIDQQLYEAAYMDGAGRFKQTLHVTLPGIVPTIVILLILNLGNLFQSNFELIYGLQNPYVNFEVISTIVFKQGIQQGAYGLATALGFVQGLVALVLTITANRIARKASGIGIW
ncbi:sugar ABC transporter permease [Paenibacillus lycopersici]|uniref:Sugar ABC transporter permease n=1 Tax=Paenibacillus lycopersici TaxID=2704462 RepID=A0A6C0FRV0_9BACL|nr:ABC transporter permease subunit [Paenibacillus lycopersici]QHT59597.1 sugar ABC transporter permease [Paenibacillus lycopersici]